ncbi:ABC transporter ATP-binding protein/permease [Streptomyces sp. NBC_01476]|uniref:ABC transporter ATP-binding protein n=1 Tax=Streptomyces sp. NBC_01476 TaxID=2903881 RepID=UPI002E312A97|nr:ABC transporter ATP-binding protein [Streptomyces sp. NBC_01476]
MPETRLRTYLRGRAGVIGMLSAWSVLEAGQTFLMGYALAKALDDGFLRGRQGTGLWWLALAAVSVPVGAYGTARVFRALAGLVEPLRDLLVRRVVRGGLRAAVARGRAGDSSVVSRLTHQVEIARDAFGGLVLVLRSFVFTAAGALAGMCALAPVLLLIVVPPLAAGIALFALALRPLARRQHRFLAADEALAEELGALAGALRDVTACGAEEPMAARADARTDAELRATRSLARWGVARAAALAVGGQFPVVLLLVGGPWLLSTGRITPGALLGALTYLTQSLQPALQNLVHTLSAAGTRLGVVMARITSDPGPSPAAPSVQPAPMGRALELHGVTFAYGPAAEPVLRDLDLTVEAGEHLAVVGPSGIGKSTLAALAAGLLRPDRGSVATAGRPALVPQEAYVFHGSVAENLRYLCGDGPSDAAVLAAVRAVGAARLVERVGGLAAEFDPATLSAGERQLVALARTYLAPAALVVLDEATCHLDPAAEAVAEAAFAGRPGGTLVVIAHRISSARRAGRVLVLDGARAVCGTHDDLPARSPLYRDLVGGWSAPGPAQLPHPVTAGLHPPGDL